MLQTGPARNKEDAQCCRKVEQMQQENGDR